VLYAFHGKDMSAGTHTFPLSGLNARRNYRLSFRDRSSADITRSGRELMQGGVTLKLALPESSELVLIEAL